MILLLHKPPIRILLLVLTFAFASLPFYVTAWANGGDRLITLKLPEQNGRQEDGGIVMNMHQICTYDSYRFEVDPKGQLFFREFATCKGDNGQKLGSEAEAFGVCAFDANLHCVSKMGRFPNVSFAAIMQGLSVNGASVAWENAQKAAQLLPAIQSAAAKAMQTYQNMCPFIFDRQLIEFKKSGKIDDESITLCKQKFLDICDNPQSKANILSMAQASKDYKGMTAQDIDGFCVTIKSK